MMPFSTKRGERRKGWIDMRNKGPLYVLVCYASWGVMPIFWKTLTQVDPFYVLAARIFWSMVFMAVLLGVQHRFHAVRAVMGNRAEMKTLIWAGIFLCFNWGFYIWAVANGRMLDGSLAYYMNPILAVLVGTIVFREKLTKLQWLSVLVTFTGLAVVVVRSGQFPWLALLIGAFFTVYGAIKKNVVVDAGLSVLLETLCLSPLALGLMIVAELRGNGAAGVLYGTQWLLLPLSGILTTIPLLAFSKGIKTTPMALSGVLMYINPTTQFLISVWLYHEEFTTTYKILFGFVWAGLILYLLSSFLEGQKHHKHKEEHSCA